MGSGSAVFFIESGIKFLRVQGSRFSSFLESGIKLLGKNMGSVTKKYTTLRPCDGLAYEQTLQSETGRPASLWKACSKARNGGLKSHSTEGFIRRILNKIVVFRECVFQTDRKKPWMVAGR